MQSLSPTLGDWSRIAEAFEMLNVCLVLHGLDFAALSGAERELNSLTQCALARLATDTEKVLALEQIIDCLERMKRGHATKGGQFDCLQRSLGVLCAAQPKVQAQAFQVLCLAARLGRTVSALELVDRALRIKGPAFVGRMLERVKTNVLGERVPRGRTDPTSDLVVQLGSRLALERISSSSACPPALRQTASVLLERIGLNLQRIGG